MIGDSWGVFEKPDCIHICPCCKTDGTANKAHRLDEFCDCLPEIQPVDDTKYLVIHKQEN